MSASPLPKILELWPILVLFICSACSAAGPAFDRQTATSPATPTSAFVPTATFAQTPGPFLSYTATLPSSAPSRTSVPSFSASPTATLASPSQTASPITGSSNQRELGSKLLFLSGDSLKIWDPAAQQVELLAVLVSEYSANPNGQWITWLQGKGITANGVELYDLALLDQRQKQATLLIGDTPRLYNISISPDGHWISYMLNNEEGPIRVLPILSGSPRKPAAPFEAGSCIRERPWECRGNTVWTAGSETMLWSDSRGIWISKPQDPHARLVFTNTLEILDPEGQKFRVRVAFDKLSWSPAGRFALVQVAPSSSKTTWQAVLDTRSSRIAEVPGSFGLTHLNAASTWLQDGRLFTALSGNFERELPLAVSIWQVFPTRHDLLALEKKFELHSTDFPDPSFRSEKATGYLPAWPAQTGQRTFSLGVLLPESGIPSVLFTFDLQWGSLDKINKIPYDIEQVLWSPDGRGAVALGSHREILYVPPDGGPLEDLRSRLGDDACCFNWISR